MDPEAALAAMRGLADEAMAIWDRCDPDTGDYRQGDQERLAEVGRELGELFQALDGWIAKGGFDPRRRALVEDLRAIKGSAILAQASGDESTSEPLVGAPAGYRVVWEIDIDALSPRAAAQKARQMQLDPDATVGVFTVRLQDDLLLDDEAAFVVIDLDEFA